MTSTAVLRGAVLVLLAVILLNVGAGLVGARPGHADSPDMDQPTDARDGLVTAMSDPDTLPGGSWTDGWTSTAGASFDETWVARAVGPSWSDWPVPLPLLVGSYSRFDNSCPLENKTRRRIYDTVVDDPGINPHALAQRVGVSRSTVRYHVRILEREGLVRTEKRRGKRRIFAVETDGCKPEPLVADPAPATILTAIATHEPVSVSGLAETVDKSVSTVSYHLEQLEEGGLIERERNGNTVLNMLSHDARARLQSGDGEPDGKPVELSVKAAD